MYLFLPTVVPKYLNMIPNNDFYYFFVMSFIEMQEYIGIYSIRGFYVRTIYDFLHNK